ncbi:MAG: NUDIX domain-containing protein [Candidatus Shapirobacteria bacterium]
MIQNTYVPSEFLPKLGDESLTIPFVGAIIENEAQEILVQIRNKQSDLKFSGTIEIPGGKLRAGESVYETLRREVFEESGMEITSILNDENTQHSFSNEMSSDVISPFCVTQSPEGPFIGLIFRCKAKGKPAKETNETKNCQWIKLSQLKIIIEQNPEKIYTPYLGPLKKLLNQ